MKTFKNYDQLVEFAEKNNIGRMDYFEFLILSEPEIIFKSIFDYLETLC